MTIPSLAAPARRALLFAGVVLAMLACGTGEPAGLGIVGPSVGTPATIAFDSGTITLSSGTSRTLVPIVRDSGGNVLANASVVWTSSNESVATISSSGVVTGITNGTSDIRATITTGAGERVAILRVNVVGGAAPPPPPGGGGGGELPSGTAARVEVTPEVTTLDAGQRVTLRVKAFDASGRQINTKFAQWAVARTDTGVVVLSNASGDSTVVTSVRCCLARVYAGMSSIRDTVIVRSGQGPVANLRSRSPFIGLPLNENANVVSYVEARDVDGDTVTRVVAFTSANPAIATVTAAGVARGVSVGSTTFTAVSEGKSVVIPVRVKANPNEPDGFTTISDRTFTAIGEDGWDPIEATKSLGITPSVDATAPRSGPSVFNVVYPAGFAGGSAPALAQRRTDVVGRVTELYTQYWVKLSSNWVGHGSGTNKIYHYWIAGGNKVFTSAEGKGSNPLLFEMRIQGVPDVRSHLEPSIAAPELAQFRRGQWQRVEIYMKPNTPGQKNGVIRWWLDGVLLGDETNVEILAATETRTSWEQVQWSPTWGGTGGTIVAAQVMSQDHVFVSGKP